MSIIATAPSTEGGGGPVVEVPGRMAWEDAEYNDDDDVDKRYTYPCPLRCLYSIVHCVLVTPPATLGTIAWLPFTCTKFVYARACCCINPQGDDAKEAMLPLYARESPAIRCFFDGAGWAVGFELGVAAWIQRQKHWNVNEWSVFAISAGCIPGLMLVLGMDIAEFANVNYSAFRSAMLGSCTFGSAAAILFSFDFLWMLVATSFNCLTLSMFCSDLHVVQEFLIKLLPADAYVRATGRFTAVAAKWPQTGFVFLNTFDSNEELVDAMLCSMNLLPGFAWMPRPYCYEGRRGCYVDGGNQQAVTALDAVMDIPVRVFARPCRETSIAPGENTGVICPIPAGLMPVSKAKLRNIMKTAALDAEEHRGHIDAVIAAHRGNMSGSIGVDIEGGSAHEGATGSSGSGFETDPLIAENRGGGSSRGSDAPGEGRGVGAAPYGSVLPSVGKVSTV